MKSDVTQTILNRLKGTGTILLLILFGGSLGYYFISDRSHSLLDGLYMTVITISTIGYGEVIDLSASPGGRIFTMGIALAGIGTLTYTFSMITALIVEGNLTDSFRRKKMEKQIQTLSDHQIVCSAERVGIHIVNELAATQRPFVVIENHLEHIEALLCRHPQALYVQGDPTDNDILLKAGIQQAAGLFATEDEDNSNLVICLSAKQLNPAIRIVSHAREPRNIDKMKRAGAESVVSAEMIGGLRMASEMTRPAVVSFLDVMLRDKDKNLRVEEVTVPENRVGKTIETLQLKRFRNLLLMALKENGEWIYNPPEDRQLTKGCVLIFMGTPEARIKLEKELKGA